MTYYVVARQRVGGIGGVRFAAPIPPCLGANYLGESSPFGSTLGDSQTGITISFGDCVTDNTILLLSLDVLQIPGAATTCCPLQIVPDPNEPSGAVIFMSCALEESPAEGRLGWLNDDGTCEIQQPPIHPSPATGATNVPLPVLLAWETPIPMLCETPQIIIQHAVFLGTTTSPPPVAQRVDPPYDPGPLLPGTTYYWRVNADAGVSEAMSPIWSFRTEEANGVHKRTWGAIKAFFGDPGRQK